MSENREKKEKMTAEARAAAAERLEEALGALPPRYFDAVFGAEAAAEEKKSAKKTRNRTAPAWLRPVAACLAVLLLGGLVVFSIPVVNNIISRRAPAELPGTDVAEADTKEEETEKKEETEKPVETEEIEVTRYNFEFTVSYQYPFVNSQNEDEIFTGWATASFNDLMKDENRRGVACASDAEKLLTYHPENLSLEEVSEILHCPPTSRNTRIYEWALDDGKTLKAVQKDYTIYELWEMIGAWDYEEERPIVIDDYMPKLLEAADSGPLISFEIQPSPSTWELVLKSAIKSTAKFYSQNGLVPEWSMDSPRPDWSINPEDYLDEKQK